ncbi:MAG: hypothetical protein ACTS9Y_13415 [Methylophilus sp.]
MNTNLLFAAGILGAAYFFVGKTNPMVRGAVISIGAVIAAKQIPYVKDYV